MAADLTALIPELQPFAAELVRVCGASGLVPRVTSTFRTSSEQRRLYARYVAGLSTLPAAPPGTSAHEYGWAFDMVVSPMEALADVGAYWEHLGGVYGGRFGDPVHFEYPGFKEALQSASDSGPGSAIAKVGLSLLVPTPVSLGVTFARWVQDHPEAQWAVNMLLAQGLPLTDLWNVELNALPKWLVDFLALW